MGRATLQGRSDYSDVVVSVGALAVQSDSSGSYSIDVSRGEVTLIATAPGYLRAKVSVTAFPGGAYLLPDVRLLAGDAAGDNIVGIEDLMLVASKMGAEVNSLADVNSDAKVDVLDLVLVGMNFGKTESPWPNR